MSTENLDIQIKALKHDADVLRADAEKQMTEFIAFASDAAKAWVPGAAKELVTRHEAVTAKLIENGRLPQMKADINASLETLVEKVTKALATDRLWPHRLGYVDDGSRSPPDRGAVYRPLEGPHATANPPHALAEAAADALEATVGAIVSKYGYPHNEYRKRRCFGDAFRLPEGFLPLIRAYSKVNAALHAKLCELREVERAKAKIVAAAEWDKG